MMIKVGHIYEWSKLNARFAVCDINYSEITIDGDVIKTPFSITCKANNGYNYMFLSDSSKEWNLIAEYPTWQEAVNSKEFKDGYKTDREIELEKKLEIAVNALITYKNLRYDGTVTNYEYIAQEALAKIKEIKG